jgi:ornithine carbamoyltransferase
LIVFRTYKGEDVHDLAKYADIPVINAYCDKEHPCQVMADFLTTREKKGKLEGVKTAITWAPSNLNKSLGIIHSSLYAGPKLGMDLSIACPKGYEPDKKVLEQAMKDAKISGAEVKVTEDINEAIDGADVIHIKAWSPHEIIRLGKEGLTAEAPHMKAGIEKYKNWVITEAHLDRAKKDVNIQHAMPVERGVEALDSILDGPNSVIYDEGENRLHAQKGIVALVV